jgi:hypothetical protein
MTVSELGDRMSAKEFGMWKMFFQMEPWGTFTEDHRVSTLVNVFNSLFRQAFGGGGGKVQPLKTRELFNRPTPEDFIGTDEEKRKRKNREILEKVRWWHNSRTD